MPDLARAAAAVAPAAPPAPLTITGEDVPGARDLRGLRVALVAGTLGQGGAERQLYFMVRALLAAGARPRVLSLTRGEFWEPRLRALGVRVEWVGQSSARVARLARVVAALRDERPDVVQSAHFYTNLYVAAAARLLGAVEIGALRSDAVNEVAGTGRVLGALSLRLPRTVAANSRTGIANAVALGVPPHRLLLLPNVVDVGRFVPRPERVGTAVRLLAVGRLGPEKRLDRLLRALAAVRRRAVVPVRATIVGDGPLRRDLEAEAARLGLVGDRVTFVGAVADVAPHYRAADLLVLTSDWEGTPNVVLEAMASGLPVVATDVGGVADVVPADAGRLVPRDDEPALADAILDLVGDPAARRACGRRARVFVERHHATARLGVALRRLYAAAGLR